MMSWDSNHGKKPHKAYLNHVGFYMKRSHWNAF